MARRGPPALVDMERWNDLVEIESDSDPDSPVDESDDGLEDAEENSDPEEIIVDRTYRLPQGLHEDLIPIDEDDEDDGEVGRRLHDRHRVSSRVSRGDDDLSFNRRTYAFRQLNHFLQATYRVINDLESGQAEHRWNSKFVRPARKEYANTVEFVRHVAEIVAGHILNEVCAGSEGSPKAGGDDLAERLLKELSSLTGAPDPAGAQSHTHGDHIRSGVANAVAEMLTTAKATGGLPAAVNAAKTTLGPRAEAERRRRGAAAATLLASGKHNYNYCDSNRSNPRVKASKKHEVPKPVGRRSSHRRTDVKRTSTDGVKSTVYSGSAIKAPVRAKPDKSANRKEQRASKTQTDAPKFTTGSRTDQTRPTNGVRTSNASKTTARKTVGGGVKPGNGKNNIATKTGRQTATGDGAVNKTRSMRQSEGASGANSQSQKNTSLRKPSAVDGPDKARKVRIEKTAGSRTDQKRQTNGMRTSNASKTTARKPVDEGVKSGNGKSGDNAVNNMRSQKQSDNRESVGEGVKSGNGKSDDNAVNNVRSQKRSTAVRRTATKDDPKKSDEPAPAIAADKNRKPGTMTGAQLKGVGGNSGTRRKTGPLPDAGGAADDKNRKLYNSNRNTHGARDGGVAEKSKTTGTRNTGSVGKKPKNPNTRINGVGKEKRDETMISEILISPAIDYQHDNASATAARDGIKEPVGTEGIFSAAEAIDSPSAPPADVRGDDSGGGGGGGVDGGGKIAVSSEKLISPAIDYHDDASLTAARDGINEPVSAEGSPRAPADVRGDDSGGGGGVGSGGGGVGSGGKNAISLGDNGKDRMLNERDRAGPDNSGTVRNRIGEQNQDETGCNATTATAADKAGGGRRTDNSCTDDDIYKLRMACVLDQADQCLNKDTGLYQAKRKGSKFEVIDLTQEEYCKLNKI